MDYKLAKSKEGYPPSLALFHAPPVDTAISKTQWQEYRPLGQLSNKSPIEFIISGSSTDYIDLKQSTIKAKVRILQKDGSNVGMLEVGLVNLSLQSLFTQVDLSLQQQVITPTVGRNYAYKAMLDTLLNYDKCCGETKIQSQLFYKDDGLNITDTKAQTGSANLAQTQRSTYTANSAVVELEGPLYVDICQQDRLIPNGVRIGIKLYQNSDEFRLFGDGHDKYVLDLVDIVLRVAHVKVNPGMMVGHAEAFKNQNALYPLKKSDIKTFTIPKGSFSFNADDIYQGEVPDEVMVVLVSSAAYSGDITQQPYFFNHYKCNYAAFLIDGNSVPTQALQPDFPHGLYTTAYLSMFKLAGKLQDNKSSMVKRVDFGAGYSIFVFDIAGEHSDDILNVKKKGNTQLSMRFSEKLPHPVTVIIYSRFQSMIQIDQARNIIV
jgi:hypothetical protein